MTIESYITIRYQFNILIKATEFSIVLELSVKCEHCKKYNMLVFSYSAPRTICKPKNRFSLKPFRGLIITFTKSHLQRDIIRTGKRTWKWSSWKPYQMASNSKFANEAISTRSSQIKWKNVIRILIAETLNCK